MSTIVLPAVRPAHATHQSHDVLTDSACDTEASVCATEIPVEEALAPVGTALALSHDDPDLGASTAEYAVIVLAAAAFGGVMAAVLSSDTVSGLLLGIIQKALSF